MASAVDEVCQCLADELASRDHDLRGLAGNRAQRVLREAVRSMPAEHSCKCGKALAGAIFTDPKVIPLETKKKLAAIVGKYLK